MAAASEAWSTTTAEPGRAELVERQKGGEGRVAARLPSGIGLGQGLRRVAAIWGGSGHGDILLPKFSIASLAY